MDSETGTNYEIVVCNYCDSQGTTGDEKCVVCKGKGKLIALKPLRKCQICLGSSCGEYKDGDKDKKRIDKAVSFHPCLVCGGSGWQNSRTLTN